MAHLKLLLTPGAFKDHLSPYDAKEATPTSLEESICKNLSGIS